jgi:hypothetical protein
MVGKFTIYDTINTLEAIFEKHKHERIIVLSTTCVGKSTINKIKPKWVDVDILLGECMTTEEIAFCSQIPWTEEIGEVYGKIMVERVKVKPGYPLFCSCVIDCEVIVYLDISKKNLQIHCKKRNVDFEYALQMKEEIEKEWNYYKDKNEKIFYYTVMAE